jgi:hypothetical protein
VAVTQHELPIHCPEEALPDDLARMLATMGRSWLTKAPMGFDHQTQLRPSCQLESNDQPETGYGKPFDLDRRGFG